MNSGIPVIGVLEGRLTPSRERGVQFFPDDNWEKEFEDAKQIGLSAIELLVRPKGLREHPLLSPEGRNRLIELSKSNNIAIPSVHGYYLAEDQYAKDIVDVVYATAEIGAKVVLISFFKERKLSLLQDSTWDRAHQLLLPATKAAQETGVQLGIETELSAQTILEFIDRALVPEAFGVYYDLGNQFACGFSVADEIRFLKEHVVGVHIKDRLPNTDPAVESKSVPLGEGCADFESAFKALKDIGYSRPLILQGAGGEDGKELERNKQYREFTESIAQRIWQN